MSKITEAKFNRQVDRNLLGITLEKAGQTTKAIELYELNVAEEFSGSHPYTRLAIIYRKCEQIDDEIRVLKTAISLYENMHKKGINYSKYIEKLKKRLDKTKELKEKQAGSKVQRNGHIEDVTFSKIINLPKVDMCKKGKPKYIFNRKEYFAEEVAIRHYESLGYKALWTENNYWWMIMSLFFWGIIFAKIKGAVKTEINGVDVEPEPVDPIFQELFSYVTDLNGMPADFFYPEFYERRRSLIMNKVKFFLNGDLADILIQSYKMNYGKKCRPIDNWNKYTLDELLISVHRLDRSKLLKILSRLIANFNENRSGLPDLIVYNDKDFFFSEVKSERDKISEKQREWHNFLMDEVGIKVETFLVTHTEA